MHYVYVLLSGNEDFYVGYTSDLKRRVEEHNSGLNKSTKGKRWKVIYYEAYAARADALERERKLKQRGQSKRFLKQRIRRSIEECS